MAADPRVVKRIQAMGSEEQRELILRLTDYATALVGYKTKWIACGRLPGAEEPLDLVHEAVRRVLDGSRRWDPDAEPDLLLYLKSVVKSILWDRMKQAEREAVQSSSQDSDELLEMIPSGSLDPEGYRIAVEDERATLVLRNKMLDALEEDEDKLVLLEILDKSGKAADISASLGMPIDEVYNRKRKIKRRLLYLREAN